MFIVMNLLLFVFSLLYVFVDTSVTIHVNDCLEDAREEGSCIYKEELAIEYYYNDLFGVCQ